MKDDPIILAFERGRKMFREGQPQPPQPPDDSNCQELHEVEWLGWMLGRAQAFDWRRKTREALGLSNYDPNDIDEPA